MESGDLHTLGATIAEATISSKSAATTKQGEAATKTIAYVSQASGNSNHDRGNKQCKHATNIKAQPDTMFGTFAPSIQA